MEQTNPDRITIEGNIAQLHIKRGKNNNSNNR